MNCEHTLIVFARYIGIIVLSSLVGAGAIVQALNLNQSARSLLFLGLVAVGIVVQFKLMARSKHQDLERRER
jgi:hypothetical protein